MNDIIVAMKDKAVYTLKEAADFLSISYSTIKRLARNAGLPVFKVGRQWRIKIEDLERYITQTKRRGSLGQYRIYFKLQVLNRYKEDPRYYFEEQEFYGKFGLREEFYKKPDGSDSYLAALAEVVFQKVPLKGGVMAVCLNKNYYADTVAYVPDEYAHWHNYRIHTPQLNDK